MLRENEQEVWLLFIQQGDFLKNLNKDDGEKLLFTSLAQKGDPIIKGTDFS